MEYLCNGFTLDVPADCFPISTDSMLLADFVKLPKHAKVLDLGSGCGTLGILLCAKDPNCTVTGVELGQQAHTAALVNIHANGLEDRLCSICEDLRQFKGDLFDCCVSNPPYFSGGPASKTHPMARQEEQCSPTDLFATAARSIKFGGDFYLVHKPQRLAELIARGAGHGLEAKRLRLVRHKASSEISLILLQLRKGAKPGLVIDEVTLFDENRQPTDFYKSVYHID